MNRRSFLATLCAVVVAPLVAVAAPAASTTLTVNQTVGNLVGQIIYIVSDNNQHGEYLRVTGMSGGVLVYERL